MVIHFYSSPDMINGCQISVIYCKEKEKYSGNKESIIREESN